MKPGKSLYTLLAVVAVATAGCGGDAGSTSQTELRIPEGAALQGDFSGSGPGTLVSANLLTDIDLSLSDTSSLAARMTYLSTSGVDNTSVKVTGTVFVPRGTAPRGGWPTVALAHPATGIQPTCAPSLSRNLLRLAPVVADFLQAGFAVTVPDYQGLGNQDSRHPFLDSRTAGSNLIDSVRAARKFARELSDRWVGVGTDQGGQASWAANELVAGAGGLGGGLQLLGSVSVSPFSNLEGLVDAAAAGTLTTEQKLVYVQYLAALKSQLADFDLDSYRRGRAADSWDVLVSCDAGAAASRKTLAEQVAADDLRPADPRAVEALRQYLRNAALPKGPASAPMLVSYGVDDPVVPQVWTDQALVQACDFGDAVQIDRQSQPRAALVDTPRTVEWINARLNGDPAVNDCAGFSAVMRGEQPPVEPSETPTSEEPTVEESTPEETFTPEETVTPTTTAPTVTPTTTAPTATPTTTAPTVPTTTVEAPVPNGPVPAGPLVPQSNPRGPLPGPQQEALGPAVG